MGESFSARRTLSTTKRETPMKASDAECDCVVFFLTVEATRVVSLGCLRHVSSQMLFVWHTLVQSSLLNCIWSVRQKAIRLRRFLLREGLLNSKGNPSPKTQFTSRNVRLSHMQLTRLHCSMRMMMPLRTVPGRADMAHTTTCVHAMSLSSDDTGFLLA